MNAFLDYAEKNTSAMVKARQRAAEKRRAKATERAAEKALAERDDLFRLWKQWRRERLDELLTGPHGALSRNWLRFCRP